MKVNVRQEIRGAAEVFFLVCIPPCQFPGFKLAGAWIIPIVVVYRGRSLDREQSARLVLSTARDAVVDLLRGRVLSFQCQACRSAWQGGCERSFPNREILPWSPMMMMSAFG